MWSAALPVLASVLWQILLSMSNRYDVDHQQCYDAMETNALVTTWQQN